MASPTRFTNDVEFAGSVAMSGAFAPPAASISNASVAAGANIAATKVNHRHHAVVKQADAADVAARTELAFRAHRACTVVGVSVALTTAPTGGDKAFTVDVKKSTAGGAFATILSAVVTIDSSKADRTVYDATLSGTPTLVEDDLLNVVVAVSGSTGSQGQGVLIDLVVEENGT